MKKLIAIIMIIGVVGYAEELKSTEKGNNYNVVDYRNDGTTYLRVGSRLTIKNGLENHFHTIIIKTSTARISANCMIEEGTPPSLVFHLSTNRIGNCKGNIKVRYRFGRAIPKADIKWFAQSDVDKCSVMTSDSDIIDEFLGSIKQQPMLSFVISRKKEMIIENIFIPKESPEAAEDFENRCIELISKWKEFMDIDQQQKR